MTCTRGAALTALAALLMTTGCARTAATTADPTAHPFDLRAASRQIAAALHARQEPVDGIRCVPPSGTGSAAPFRCLVDRGSNRAQLEVRATWNGRTGRALLASTTASTEPEPGASAASPEAAASAELAAAGLTARSLSCALPSPTTATCTATLAGGGGATARVKLDGPRGWQPAGVASGGFSSRSPGKP